MKSLFLECYSGISGDMTVAALLDLGADAHKLRAALDSLHVGGYHLHMGRAVKCGISAFDFDVHLEAHEHHDHEHHDHEHHDHDHEHRNLADIVGIIDRSSLSDTAKKTANDIFGIVARAEAKVHGLPVDEVHFHEVGAIDSIVDIVAAAVCLEDLGVDRVYCTPLYEGTGTVKCQHGIMPVPAPATAEIVASSGLRMTLTDNIGEMVTPTGAAIAAAISCGIQPQSFKLLKTGYGAGKKDFERANVLRAHLIEEMQDSAEEIVKLECNLDNMTGEQLGFAMDRLFDAGALDVWFTPIQMKKNRPATLLGVLCKPSDAENLTACILTHTGTIGVRRCTMQRTVMERQMETVSTAYGEVVVKRSQLGGVSKTAAEYDSASVQALKNDVPIKHIYTAVEG